MFSTPKRYLQRPGWQRFIAGFILGSIVGWIFFVFFNGLAQERQIEIIHKQRSKIESLEKDKNIWQEDVKEENKELQKKLTVQDLHIDFTEASKSKVAETERSKLEEQIRNQLSSILTQNIESVAANRDLIYLIENKTYDIDEEAYRVKIQSLVLYSTVELVLKVSEEP